MADAVPVELAFDASGRAIASWHGLQSTEPMKQLPLNALAGRSPGADWRVGPILPSTVIVHDLVVYGRSSMALASWRQHALPRSRSRSSIVLTLGDTGTLTFGHPRRLDSGPARRLTPEGPQITLATPKVAATAGGDVLVAWQRTDPRSQDGVWIGGRLRSGRSMRPRRLGPHGGEPFLSLAPDGSGLLAWKRGRRILARLRTPDGR